MRDERCGVNVARKKVDDDQQGIRRGVYRK